MKRALPLVFSSILACASMAQVSFGGRASQPNILNAGAGYLAMPAVQKELGLSATVSKKIQDKITASTRAMMGSMQSANTPRDPKERGAAIQKQMASMQKVQGECVALLTPSQKVRLKQITLQQMGPQAMYNPEVKKELGLNESQTKKIGEIMQSTFRQMFSNTGVKPGERPSREDAIKRMQEFAKKQDATRAKTNSETMKVLSPTQRAKWKSMQGKPFKIDMTTMMRSVSGGAPKRVK